jgi:hypothetical protein
VAVNIEASGTFNERIANGAYMRMQAAGVQIMNMFSINGELFRDVRSYIDARKFDAARLTLTSCF